MHSLALQFPRLAADQRVRLEADDELFRYDIEEVVSSADFGGLKEWRITATPRTRGEPNQISFLAP